MVHNLLTNPMGNLEKRLRDLKFDISVQKDMVKIMSYSGPGQATLYGIIIMGCDFKDKELSGVGSDMVSEYLAFFYRRVEAQEDMVQEGTASLIKTPELSLQFKRPGLFSNDEFNIYGPVNSIKNYSGRVFGEDKLYAKVSHHTQLCDTFDYLVSLSGLCAPSESFKNYKN